MEEEERVYCTIGTESEDGIERGSDSSSNIQPLEGRYA
jgi:hypothetical protein